METNDAPAQDATTDDTPAGDTPEAPRKVVPVEFEYEKFTPEGHSTVTETRHIYYTMGSVAQMMDEFGVPQERARKVAEGGDPDVAEDELEEIIENTETGLSHEEGVIVMLWSGLQAEARGRGEDLTIGEVGDMIDLENIEEISERIAEAWEYFQEGESTDDSDADDSGKGRGGEATAPPKTTKSPR